MGCRKRWEWLSFSHRSGFLLFELLLALFLFAFASLAAVPMLWDWQEERELDLASEEVASAIREAQMIARNESEDAKGTPLSASVEFFCAVNETGRVAYWSSQGNRYIQPSGTLPANVYCSGRIHVLFRKDGFAGSMDKSRYSMQLRTKDGKHRQQITVAMYTGRVRVTRIK